MFLAVLLACSTVSSCMGIQGEDEPNQPEGATTNPDEFCDAMGHLIVLLEPTDRSSPAEKKETFDEAAVWFEQARQSAPDPIADDVAIYADAYESYTTYLDESGYSLDVVFSTDEGTDLAIDTSHTLTPGIVDYVTGECALTFGSDG